MNADSVDVVVAVAALIVAGWSVLYSRKQVGIAKQQVTIAEAARAEARRSADAAEQQVAIAAEARAVAEAATAEARKMGRLEARRQHDAGALKDIKLHQTALRRVTRSRQFELDLTLTNHGSRPYDYVLSNDHHAPSARHSKAGTIKPGQTVPVTLIGMYPGIRIEALFTGECPCDEPDHPQGHWRNAYDVDPDLAPDVVAPDEE